MDRIRHATRRHASGGQERALGGGGPAVFAALVGTTPTPVLLARAPHAGNVLRAQREPWLVIDPKPFVGDPAYDATQHLLNCRARLRADPDRLIRRFADLLSVDHDRVRLWLFARVVTTTDGWSGDSLMDVARLIGP